MRGAKRERVRENYHHQPKIKPTQHIIINTAERESSSSTKHIIIITYKDQPKSKPTIEINQKKCKNLKRNFNTSSSYTDWRRRSEIGGRAVEKNRRSEAAINPLSLFPLPLSSPSLSLSLFLFLFFSLLSSYKEEKKKLSKTMSFWVVEPFEAERFQATKDYSFERSNSMEAAIYRAAIAGDIDGLTTALQQNSQLNLLNQLTPRDDTILHIAARLGHHHLVEPIQSSCPDLFKSKNCNDDHPLHLAAAGGHLPIVQSLITNALRFATSSSRETEAEQEVLNVTKGQNKQGNTPLHMAVKDRQYEVAFFLFRRPGSELTSCFPNLEKKSPLYMAAEAGHEELFELMMQFVASKVDAQNMLKDGQPLLHVAITTRNKVILETALKYVPSLIDAPDRTWRKPLSYAASIGYVDGICYILDTFVDSIYKRDHDGSYPIHEASRQGHIEVVKEFLRRFPDSRELLNVFGQNILHVAAESGKANIVSYILEVPELEMLINGTDRAGDTPLLLASKNAQAKIVSILTWDKRVRLEIENGECLTALDVSLNFMETTSLIHQRLTRMALRYASAPRGQPMTTGEDPKKSRLPVINLREHVKVYKDRVNTLLLVATIIITVTFAAGITVPGGYDDSETHKGMALMVKKSAFQVFVIANAVAMYSSIIVAVLLIWAQLGDLNLIRVSLNLASPLFGGALMMVAIAFMTGVYLVVSNLNWLSHVILIMGLIFVLALSTLLILLFLPASVNHRMLRYIFYYPFSLLLLIIKKWS